MREREEVWMKEGDRERKRDVLLCNVGGRDSLRSFGRGEGGASYCIRTRLSDRSFYDRMYSTSASTSPKLSDCDVACIRQDYIYIYYPFFNLWMVKLLFLLYFLCILYKIIFKGSFNY